MAGTAQPRPRVIVHTRLASYEGPAPLLQPPSNYRFVHQAPFLEVQQPRLALPSVA